MLTFFKKFKKSTLYILIGLFLWAFYWGYAEYNVKLQHTTELVSSMNRDCKDSIESCAEFKASEVSRMMGYEIQTIFAKLIFFLILFWCSFITIKYLCKFIKNGLSNEFKWSDIKIWQKFSLVSLVTFNILVFLFLYFLLDDYQKSTHISVIPNSWLVVHKYPEKNPVYISAEGSWQNNDDYSISPFGIEMQTSKLKCNKSINACYEAIAKGSEKYMYVDLREYQIFSWSNDAVSFGEESECLKELTTIDVATKSVSRSLEYKKISNCDSSFKNEYFHMVKGIDIYMKERDKLDSLFTKFIKFLFNNK